MSAIDEVQRADDTRLNALLARDIAGLQKLLHPDLRYTHANGLLDDRQSYLDALISGKVVYKSAQRKDVKIRVYGDMALLTGIVSQVVSVDGVEATFLIRYSITWIKSANGWQMLMWHASKII